MRVALVLLLLLLAPLGARAAGVVERLAVLRVEPMESVPAEILSDVELLDAPLRGLVTRSVRRGLSVMTQEDIAENFDPSELKCGVNGCMATIGRKLQAKYVVGAMLRRQTDGKLSLTIEAYRSTDARLLGARPIIADGIIGLVNQLSSGALVSAVSEWLSEEGLNRSSDTLTVPISFVSDPPGAGVLVSLESVCQRTPCTEDIPVGTHEVAFTLQDYATKRVSVDVRPDMADRTVRVSLAPSYAAVTLVTDPPGLPVSLDGKTAVREGLKGQRLRPGPHEAKVVDQCYAEVGETFIARVGEVRTVTLKAQPRLAAVDLVVLDANDNVMDATVRVDGQPVSGRRFKVPLCSREIEAVVSGDVVRSALMLKEKDLTQVTLRAKVGSAQVQQDMGSVGRDPLAYATRAEWLRRAPSMAFAADANAFNGARLAWISGLVAVAAGLAVGTYGLMQVDDLDSRQTVTYTAGALFISGLTATVAGLRSDVRLQQEGSP